MPSEPDPPLNPPQREAVDHPGGKLVVLAGAGTGKTRVLVNRVARLVQRGASPWSILAVTFTNKAADEMRDRLRKLLGEAADAMEIGTFHATCARLLRRFGEQVGLSRSFAIYDERDAEKILRDALREAGLAEAISPAAIASRMDLARDADRDPTALGDVEARIYPMYRARLMQEDATDFCGLLEGVCKLLDVEPAASRLRSLFQHVLVDEFQDTNKLQLKLVRGLADRAESLTVVGDDDQAIYAWRGAEPKNLLSFHEEFPDTRVIKLEQNYRSTGSILAAANSVISKNRQRRDKSLWTDRGTGERVEVIQVIDEHAEADFVARAASALMEDRTIRPRDICVLYRTNQQSRVLEEHLRASRIPSRVIGSTSFYERKEIRDVLAYLRVAVNPGADSALERAIGAPPRGVGDATMDRLRSWAQMSGQTLTGACEAALSGEIDGVGTRPRRGIEQLLALFKSIRAELSGGASAAQIVSMIIERSGLSARLREDKTDDARDRLRDLEELVNAATDADAARVADIARAAAAGTSAAEAGSPSPAPARDSPSAVPSPVSYFLERLALFSPGDEAEHASRSKKRPVEDPAGQVSMMTIHIAKGLEWPVVFLTGAEEGIFPSLRGRGEASVTEDDLEEERRIAYVAITRARDLLVITNARTRRVYGETRTQLPSRFLLDIPRDAM